MKKTLVLLVIGVAIGAVIGAALQTFGSEPERPKTRHGISPAEASKLLATVDYDVDTSGALRLPAWDPETNLHKDKPAAYNRRREAERLEKEYRQERLRRIKLTERIVDATTEKLKLDTEQAGALYRLIMERGDKARVAAYYDLFGAHDKKEKIRQRTEAEKQFELKLKLLFTADQYHSFRELEEGQGRGVPDLGFGAAYGKGGGKDRSGEPLTK